MNEDAQRVALAAADGWTNLQWTEIHNPWNERRLRGIPPASSSRSLISEVPFYRTDLNAMNWLERKLAADSDYGFHLSRVTGATIGSDMMLFSASAKHRAEAYLRTIGKWVDSP